MKAVRLMLLILSLTSWRGLAQQTSLQTGSGGSLNFDVPALRPSDAQPAGIESRVLGKQVRLEGPLVAPVKSKKIWDLPRRLVRSLNPFAKSEYAGPREDLGMKDARAWSTVVGWNTRSSAFLDDTHHEPELRLLTISTAKP